MANEDLLVVIGSSVLADSEPDLGETLMRGFLAMLPDSGEIPAMLEFGKVVRL